MKLAPLLFVSTCLSSYAGTVIIDDFSAAQETLEYWGRGVLMTEMADASIFGGYRHFSAMGYNPTVVVNGIPGPSGESPGMSSIGVSGGVISFSKARFFIFGCKVMKYQC